ncbi:aldose epimerase family protein [Sphingosinicella sp. CPCC 101087]|uniref:aldose epimerase family protein n=1 Tax=Sphingosinicella sp. CPCC 101087 TaxID=2497754 RepID=UPI00101C15C7|nr:aldose epimerase family protein [Sphingosinicella sp. CPCC 101087]
MRIVVLAGLAAFGLATPAESAGVEMRSYGVTSKGETVREYSLTGSDGMVVRFLDYGGIVTAIEVPDGDGARENVVLGLPSLADYEAKNSSYWFGGIVGRYAGRIANARFALDGREVRLTANDGPNALHGGFEDNFITRVWRVEPLPTEQGVGAVLHYSSPDGEQGFPGRLDVAVTYRLLPGALRIDYRASADSPTVLNLTNHSYFNLAGAGGGPVFDHRLQLFADRIVDATEAGIPTGAFTPVAGTAFDFREPRPVGDCLAEAMPRIGGFCGYNHSWLVEAGDRPEPVLAGRLSEPQSGRTLEVLTTEPALHVYVANHFPGGDIGAAGVPLRPHHGIALETQHLPDSPNRPEFPSTLLRPGETFRSTTIYRFGVEGQDEGSQPGSRRRVEGP